MGWEPRVCVRDDGLAKATAYFAKESAVSGEIVLTGPDASIPPKQHHVDKHARTPWETMTLSRDSHIPDNQREEFIA